MSVRCGNRKVHGPEGGVHETASQSRACFAGTYQATAAPAPAPTVPNVLAVAQGTLHEGYFTVVFEADDRITLRVRRQRKDSKFRPGELIVSYLSGSDNEGDYTGFAFVDESGSTPILRLWKKFRGNERLLQAVKVLAGDPQAAALAYAIESGNCSKCNRLLTVPQGPKSQGLNPYRVKGLGPDCGEKILG